ncbi:hypothetical protein BJY52DRAFT_1273492 [Lactarius psammicola]|nr:hypothetical protein BJY52DRAFT_1273492 [Lactarius psammicola]
MHNLIELCYFLLTTTFVVGSILIIALLVRKCSAVVDATKSSLEKRGWKVSRHGISVPVSKRATLLDREHYLDATQRGLSKAAHASTFGCPTEHNLSRDRAPVDQWSRSRSASATAAAADASVSEHKHHRRHLFKRHMD